MRTIIAVALLAFGLAGCASDHQVPNPAPADPATGSSFIDDYLSQVASTPPAPTPAPKT